MDESNWWLYLIGAAVAYYFVPWGAVLKWLAVAICVGIAFAFFFSCSFLALSQGVFFIGVLLRGVFLFKPILHVIIICKV